MAYTDADTGGIGAPSVMYPVPIRIVFPTYVLSLKKLARGKLIQAGLVYDIGAGYRRITPLQAYVKVLFLHGNETVVEITLKQFADLPEGIAEGTYTIYLDERGVCHHIPAEIVLSEKK